MAEVEKEQAWKKSQPHKGRLAGNFKLEKLTAREPIGRLVIAGESLQVFPEFIHVRLGDRTGSDIDVL